MMQTEAGQTPGENGTFRQGTLLRGIGSFYTIMDAAGERYTLRCKKKFRRLHLTPLPGDEVMFTPGNEETHGWIEEILPRKSVFLRPPVANISCLVIVAAPVPETDFLLADRMISRAVHQKVRVLIAANKADLDPGFAGRVQAQYEGAGIRVFGVSAQEGTGIGELKEALQGETCCFAGQSGVGKSTLLSLLFGVQLETGEISRKIARGKNTTRQVELYVKDGLRAMDTAGFNLLEAECFPPEELRERYPEFLQYEGKCRFRECLHDTEPGCAVQEAVRQGLIAKERHDRYRSLLAETREAWRNRYD